MSQNKSVNTLENGLIRIDNPTKQPKNSYSFALNATINDNILDITSLTNEKDFVDYYNMTIGNHVILGYTWLGREEYVLFIKNIDGESIFNRIVYINITINKTTIVYDNILLNFQSNNLIKSTYRINYKNQRIVYFVDGLNDDRVINIDKDNSFLDIALISLGADSVKPLLTATIKDSGGNITSGQYFIGLSYNLGEDFTTNVSSISNGMSIASESYYDLEIITDNINRDFGNVDGDLIPIPTNKSIEINISELDPNYTSYNILIIKADNDGNTVVKIIKNIALSTTRYIYTGNEGAIDSTINLNSIIVETIKYFASEAITQKENRLLRGNAKLASSKINYQAFANNIIIKYKINEERVFNDSQIYNNRIDTNRNRMPPIRYNDTTFKHHSISPSFLSHTADDSTDNKSFMRDEVYSFGIGFELTDGTETEVYHIPGRLHDNIYTEINAKGEYNRSFEELWDTKLTPSNKPYWLERNTALNDGTLSYWRSDETYTDGYNYPTNGEKNTSNKSYIRHHKMPSDILEPTFRTVITGNPNVENTTVKYELYKRNIALKFFNIEIPDEYEDIIKKVKIFYTPRNNTNKSILSKGILQGTNSDSFKRQLQQSEGGLMEFRNIFEFISPEVNFKFKESNLSGSRIKICGLDKAYINYVGYGFPTGSLNNIFQFNQPASDTINRKQKLVTSFVPFLERVIPHSDLRYQNINKLVYVDNNYRGSTNGIAIDFTGSQKTSILELSDGIIIKPTVLTTPIADVYPELRLPTGSTVTTSVVETLESNDEGGMGYQLKKCFDTVYYVSIINDNRSLYGKIEDLEYVNCYNSLVKIESPIISYDVVRGDVFIDMHHYKKTYVKAKDVNDTTEYSAWYHTQLGKEVIYEFGSTVFGSFMCETDINIRMRREGEGLKEKYFPKSLYSNSTAEAFGYANINEEFYKIENSYNINHLKYYFSNPYKQEDFDINENGLRYSTRIIYSDKQELEDKIDNYRIARANNYRDLPLNRGPITIFFNKQTKLYAITRDSIFDVFASNQTIKSENADNIVVGTGEFLSIEPSELIAIDGGYGGSTSKLSVLESPFGYLFIDRFKNKCLLFSNDLKDINVLGLNENFKLEAYEQIPELELESGFDNPLNKIGIIAIYDPRLKRIIITKLDYVLLPEYYNKYKGIFDNTIEYEIGDIYLKQNILYISTITGEQILDITDYNIIEDKSFTASFNPNGEKWISYHTYMPNLYLPHITDFILFEDNKLKISNGNTYSNKLPFIIETIFNENPLITKVYDSLNLNVESYDKDQRNNEFFDKVLIYNDMQSSGQIELTSNNLTKKEKDWNINKFLDKASTRVLFSKEWNDKKNSYYIDKVVHSSVQNSTKPWYKLARFRDKYLIARFTYDNLEMSKLIVNFVNTIFRGSTR